MDDARAQTTFKNGEISCSIEETNRIRLSLGLKPLREARPESLQPAPKAKSDTVGQLRARLGASRAARKHRSAAIAPRSIAEQALFEDDDDEAQAWVERSRLRTAPKTPVVQDQFPEPKPPPSEDQRNVADSVKLSGGETKTLTLRDVDVVQGGDVLEDHVAAAQSLKKKREEEINGMIYNGTDTAHFGQAEGKEGAQSVADLPRVVENDYEGEPVFRKVKKRSKKRRRRDPLEIVAGSAHALRKAANAEFDKVSDDDEHYELLRKATAKAAERNVTATVDRILKAVEKAERGGDAEMDDGARLVDEEMAQILGYNAMGGGSDSEDGRDRRHVEAQEKPKPKPTEKESKGELKGDVVMEDAKNKGETDEAKLSDAGVRPPSEATPEAGLETNGMTGVAATLARLRTMGDLKHKLPQKGRARDKRFEDAAKSNGKKEIKLSYLDEFGNQLTPKEAFRVLCHSFHGNAPGQNKREKRLRKLIEDAKQRRLQGDDTPLASAAALKAETRRLGSAHVVLSGVHALEVPETVGNGVANGETDASEQ